MTNEKFLFSSESVTEGHPDKVCDLIADSILDEALKNDPDSHIACEVCCTTGMAMVMGEFTTDGYIDIPAIARNVIKNIGYDNAEYGFDGNTCAVLTAIDEQSQDIAMGVNNALERREGEIDPASSTGAGDQGMMFGYACRETEQLMPLPITLAHALTKKLSEVRKSGEIPYLRPDGKAQVTVAYENGVPAYVDTVVVSTQHDENVTREQLEQAVIEKVIKKVISPKYYDKDTKIYINPTGKFVIGGPKGDSGVTGRKIIVDTYGGMCPHGGGAFSGKDPSKVDRSAAYAARHIAKNMVAAGVADEMLVQVAYAIGVARPVSIFVDTYGTGIVPDAEIARKIEDLFDLRPAAIIRKFELKNPIYEPTAAYGHFGRKPYTKTVKVGKPGHQTDKLVQFFGWEKLDAVDAIKKAFNL